MLNLQLYLLMEKIDSGIGVLQIDDRGKYHCRATNKFGSVTSGSVQLSFAYVAEFNLKRSDEQGNQFWGKAIYCDPPQHFPGEMKIT